MQTFSQESIGTRLSLHIKSKADLDPLWQRIQSRLITFEQKYSRFIEGNWLDSLNTTKQSRLDDESRFLFRYALDISQQTNGYFDMTVGSRLSELGYGRLSSPEISPKIPRKRRGDYRSIEIRGDEILLHYGIEVEMGGIGKGYLIDSISEMIEEYMGGSESIQYLVNFGGDMRSGGVWSIGLENPYQSDEVIGVLDLDSSSLACSAPTKRRWGVERHHLIDPYTGQPSREILSSYIEGSSGISTDCYATALAVMPWSLACEKLENTREIEGILIHTDGRSYQSRGSRAKLFR